MSNKLIKDDTYEEILPNYELIPFLDNEFIKDVSGSKLYYTKDFYVAMYKKIHDEDMSYVAAYNALGFDTTILGEDRANSAGKRAVEMAENHKLYTQDETNYDGTVPREMMGDLSDEEELAYLKARTHYLETMLEAQKKIQSELAMSDTFLKNVN